MQPPRADVLGLFVDLHRERRELLDPVRRELQVDALDPEQMLVLFGQRVARLRQDRAEVFRRQRVELDADRKAALQLRDQVRRFAGVKRAGRDEQDVVGLDRAVLRL